MAKEPGKHQNEALCGHHILHILFSGAKKTKVQLFQLRRYVRIKLNFKGNPPFCIESKCGGTVAGLK